MTLITLRHARALALGLVLFAARAGAQAPPPAPPPPPAPGMTYSPMPGGGLPNSHFFASPRHLVGPPGIAASVNGQAISKAQVSALAYEVAGPEVLDRIINNTLVEQAARKQGLTAPPAEVNTRYGQVKQDLMAQQRAQGLPVQSIDALLAQSHQTPAMFRETLRLRILAEKLVAGKIGPIKMVHARHILVLTNANATPGQKAHTDGDAQKIIAKAQGELKAGKAWDDVCKRYSEDPSNKDKGGDLGLIGTGMTNIDPTFLAAALALNTGEVTPSPVKSVFGYHLIKVDSTSLAPASPQERAQYAAAVAAARSAQFQQIIPVYLQSLRAQARVLNYITP